MIQTENLLGISVIVPTYNRSRLLDFTLHSLAIQNLPKSCFEVLVVDDGSSDNTREVVENYQNHLNIRYYFQEDKGYRPGSARNIGIMNASSNLCMLVDSGVLLGSDCVGSHLRFHTETGQNVALLGYVYGLYDDTYSRNQLEKMIDPYLPTESIAKLKADKISPDIREKQYQKYNDTIFDLPAPWVMFLSCNVSVNRDRLIEVGMFDEKFDGRWGCEDNDLGFRLHKHGTKIMLCRDAEAVHFPHDGDTAAKVQQGYNNCIYFNSKHQTEETNLFLKHYKEIAISESIDINEIILSGLAFS
ncbi:MAG: hypothetical protein AVDCRST_MAG56-5061 [uncultured Cytophagales bacterium]|uniref:Uncharacterized protein n=1 Tax=uncultured Cytophagales bacterium TaxID=158755 RepID=A0A6J4K5Z6_9SPHI|nr:MAG: hypothetical protein AVDCRST_MAG56-5061 [uncultured Cytophagales bacterium]